MKYTAEALRAQRLLCCALSAAPYATLPARKFTQGRVICAISKLFIADLPDASVESSDATLHPAYLPVSTIPAGRPFSPEIQAPVSWHVAAGATAACAWHHGGATPSSQADVADCSRVVRGALRHNFATLVATVLSSAADRFAKHATVDVVAADRSQDARTSAISDIPRFSQNQQAGREQDSDCTPMSITLAVCRALQLAVKHLSSSPAASSVDPCHVRLDLGSAHHPGAPGVSLNQADACPLAHSRVPQPFVAPADSAAVHRSSWQDPFAASMCPAVHTPAMLGGALAGEAQHVSASHGGALLEVFPSGTTPPVDNKPSIQHGAASAVRISRSFMNVNPALIDCIERAFDAASHRWADEHPGLFAGTPMYPRARTPLRTHSAAVPSEVESVLALCGSLGDDCESLLPHEELLARMSPWLTSMLVDPPLVGPLPSDDAAATASPLLQLRSPLSPFGGYGVNRSSGFVVTMMHAVPMAALVTSLDAAMKLPMHWLPGLDAAQYIHTMVALRSQLHASCYGTLRGTHKAISSSEGPSSTEAVQAVAAARTALSCVLVAVESVTKSSKSRAHQQVSLSSLQAIPEAVHTLHDVAWRSPLPNTKASVQSIMVQLIQNTTHCDMLDSLAGLALDLASAAPQGGTAPRSDGAPSAQWLCVALFAISSLTACAVASVPDSTSIPARDPAHRGGATGPAMQQRYTLETSPQQPPCHTIARDQVAVVVTAALKLILKALALPVVACKGGAAAKRSAAPAEACSGGQGAVTPQQWRAWLTVLLQLCLEAAAAELEAPVSEGHGSSDSDFESLHSVLVETGNYLTSAKVRLHCSSNLS